MVYDKLCQTERKEGCDTMKRVVLVNPPIVTKKNDVTGTGVPFWPIPLAIIAAILDGKYEVKVVDMFGRNPTRKTIDGNLIMHGVPILASNFAIKKDDIVVIYSGHAIAHTTVLKIIERIKLSNPKKIIIIENTNFVNAYPLDYFYDDFKKAGAVIIAGDPYGVIKKAIDGDYDTKERHQFMKVDSLPMPKWDGFPLENYWDLNYAHAPKTNKKYLQIYTSFGCPGICLFCTNPYINKSCWRPKSVKGVLEEITFWYAKGIREFHIEDLNPTVDKERILDLCKAVIHYGLKDLDLKIAAGTKIDYLDSETIRWMADAGFTYISFSPESGSKQVLELMNKKFEYEYVLGLIENMPRKIITQACFILGYPGETIIDRNKTKKYAIKLAKAGVDEFAFFNFVPSVGSKISESMEHISTDDMTFSSDWRAFNKTLRRIRLKWIIELYVIKMLTYPIDTIVRFFRTKTWMTIKRVFL